VDGPATLAFGADVTGGAFAVGSEGAGQNVILHGSTAASYVEWVASSNEFTVRGDVSVAGPATLNGDVSTGANLFVTGDLTTGGTASFGRVTLGSTARRLEEVPGRALQAQTGADLIVYGDTAGSYLSWDSSADMLDVSGAMAVSGDSALNGLTTVAGGLVVSAQANFTHSVALGADLGVAGDATVDGAVAVGGSLSASGGATVEGGAALGGAVHLGAEVSDPVSFGGSIVLPRHRVDVLSTSDGESCVVDLSESLTSYSVVMINATASLLAGCADWIALVTPLCDESSEGVILGLSALGSELDAVPVYNYDGDESRKIVTSNLPTDAEAAANAARVGANIFPIYGGYSGVSLICSSGVWEKINGGASAAAPGTQEAERLIIDTGDFDFVGGVNLNGIKGNTTNASDIGDIAITGAPATADSSADGGSIYLEGGGASNGDGGDIGVRAGSSSDGLGGSISMNAGASTAASADAGSVSLEAGDSTTGRGGGVSVAAGDVTGGSSTADAGDVVVTGGTSVGGAGGSVLLSAGTGSTEGVVELSSATSLGQIKVEDAGVTIQGGLSVGTSNLVLGGAALLCITQTRQIGICDDFSGAFGCTSCTPLPAQT